jgi:serine/threonine protein kinase
MNETEIKRYTDEYFEVHQITEKLGRGGQGAVYKTTDPDIAIKLVIDEKGETISNKEQIEKYSDRLRNLRFLPFPKNAQISMPLAVLKNNAGYVMQLANDMKPIGKLLSGSSQISEIPDWLKEMDESAAKQFMHYLETGGTKFRLNILYKLASLLSKLHANALIYGDISPNNIFYSDDSIFLIDADNICLQTAKTRTIYTPQYGAPEVIEGKTGITLQSDVWAFAVLAYEILSMNYPFSDTDESGNTVSWTKAQTNQNSNNSNNYNYSELADNGLQSLIFTEKLLKLFKQTLLQGRINPLSRPQMSKYAVELAKTADKILVCPNCKMSYFYDYEEDVGKNQCPFCGTKRPEIMLLESYFWKENKKSDLAWKFAITTDKTINIPKRVVGEFLMSDGDSNCLEISFEDNFIVLKKLQNEIVLYVAIAKTQQFQQIFGTVKIGKCDAKEFFLFAEGQNSRIINVKIIGGKQ